jgi:integrase
MQPRGLCEGSRGLQASCAVGSPTGQTLQTRDRFLHPDEVPKFFNALETDPDQDIRDIFYLALYTGARRGNLLRMRWDELNLDSAS